MAIGEWRAEATTPGPMQAEVLARARELVLGSSPPSDAPSEEAALRELLRGHSLYDSEAAVNLAPYRPGQVSLPTDLRRAPRLEDVCGPQARFSGGAG